MVIFLVAAAIYIVLSICDGLRFLKNNASPDSPSILLIMAFVIGLGWPRHVIKKTAS